MVFITWRHFISAYTIYIFCFIFCCDRRSRNHSSSWSDCELIFNEKLNIRIGEWLTALVALVVTSTQINQWINFVIACKIQTMCFSIVKTSLNLQMPLITKIYVVYPCTVLFFFLYHWLDDDDGGVYMYLCGECFFFSLVGCLALCSSFMRSSNETCVNTLYAPHFSTFRSRDGFNKISKRISEHKQKHTHYKLSCVTFYWQSRIYMHFIIEFYSRWDCFKWNMHTPHNNTDSMGECKCVQDAARRKCGGMQKHTHRKKKIYSILWLSINLNPKPQVKVNLLWKCILCFRCTIPSIDFMTNAFTDSGSFHLNTLICWMVFRSSFQLNVVYHYMSFLQRARIYLFRSHHPFGKSDIWTVCIYRLKPMSITSRFERKNNWLLVEICLWFVIASNNYIIYVYNAKPRLCLLSLSRIILRVFDQFSHSVSLSYSF